MDRTQTILNKFKLLFDLFFSELIKFNKDHSLVK